MSDASTAATGAAGSPGDLSYLTRGTPVPPTAQEAARAKIEALKANPEWVKRHVAGSHETKEEMRLLHEQMHALPAGTIISGAPSIEQQRNEIADWLAENGHGLDAEVIDQVRHGIPESAEVHQEAASLKKSLMADPEFCRKLMNDDHDAKRKMLLINIILSGPIALAK
jgi:hypothetical protein